jgi:hypothetical protein
MCRPYAVSFGIWGQPHCIGLFAIYFANTGFIKQLLIANNCSCVLSRFHNGMKPRGEIPGGVRKQTCLTFLFKVANNSIRLLLKKSSWYCPPGQSCWFKIMFALPEWNS